MNAASPDSPGGGGVDMTSPPSSSSAPFRPPPPAGVSPSVRTRSVPAPSRASLLRTGSAGPPGVGPTPPPRPSPQRQQQPPPPAAPQIPPGSDLILIPRPRPQAVPPPPLSSLPRLPSVPAKGGNDDDGDRGSASSADDEDMPDECDGDYEGAIGLGSVVKVYATIQEPDYGNPWQTVGIESATGSGVAVRDSSGVMRVLTAAHVVADQTYLQVQRTGVESPDKYAAGVHAVRHECDLALLSVESCEFWDGLRPARLGPVPRHRSLVLVAGFPVGGDELSITEGVVSRIEGQPYAHSRRNLPAVTVDAAINRGNSGGPAFNDRGDLVGIAFQALDGAENTGHCVPTPVVRHFLDGVSASGGGAGGYMGFPSAGVQWQELTNPYLRRHLGLDDGVRGVLITDVHHGNTCRDVLERGDVLTRVGGRAVANNGTVSYGRYGRVNAAVAFTTYQCGDTVELGIVRGGSARSVSAVARPYRRLVPLSQHDRRPPYFIYCGLVFQPLSLDYLDALGGYSAALADLLYSGRQSDDRLQVVLLSQTLSDGVNIGYETLTNKPITTVNGESIRDLRDLVDKVEGTPGDLLRFETVDADVIIVPAPGSIDAKDANERILERYRVGRDRFLPTTETETEGAEEMGV